MSKYRNGLRCLGDITEVLLARWAGGVAFHSIPIHRDGTPLDAKHALPMRRDSGPTSCSVASVQSRIDYSW